MTVRVLPGLSGVAPDIIVQEDGTFEPIEGGFRIKTCGAFHVDVIRMIYNWRVCSTPVATPLFIDRSFCFAGLDQEAFLRAVAGAYLWDPNDVESEPPGWNKNVQTGEWREPK